MTRIFLTIAFCIAVLLPGKGTLFAGDLPQSRVMLHGEIGSFNKSYPDLQYVDREMISFATLMTNFGGEYRYRSAEGNLVGTGIVQTSISSGKAYNFDHYEYQPLTLITLPYAFVGKDFGFFTFEIGISWYFYFNKFDARNYYNSDGSEYEKDDAGLALNRRESHAFINFMTRIFPENFIHLKIRVCRERFNAADSIINMGAVFPVEHHTGELFVSLLPPRNWFENREGILRSNQRLNLAYSYSFSFLRIGLEMGILVNNRMGGEGSMAFFNRLSCGLFTEAAW